MLRYKEVEDTVSIMTHMVTFCQPQKKGVYEDYLLSWRGKDVTCLFLLFYILNRYDFLNESHIIFICINL